MNIAIDLDNTLLTWRGDGSECGDWLPGAKIAVNALLEEGVGVIVHTCRTTWEAGGGVDSVLKVLRDAGFEPELCEESWSWPGGKLGVWIGKGKPVAMAYVDDRAVRFEGDWLAVLEQLSSDYKAGAR